MIYTIKNNSLVVQISTLGAELQSIKAADGLEYLWQGDPKYWTGRAKNLFPYIARLNDGRYTYAGREYRMPIHGFVPTAELTAVNLKEDSITFELEANEDTYAQYPFLFKYSIIYQLEGNKLLLTIMVQNKDDKKMYFAVGGHPGFNIPLTKEHVFEDYYLEFSKRCTPIKIGFDEATCLLNGEDIAYPLSEEKRICLLHEIFNQDAIVLTDVDKTVTLKPAGGGRSVTVRYPDMDYLGIWHKPHTDAPYVCIEPWSSLPSRADRIEELEKQDNLLTLDAGKTYQNHWEIELN